MHGSELLVNLCQRVNSYMNSGVRESLVRNKHMNDYDGEEFNSEEVRQHLLTVVEDFCKNYEGARKSGEVIRGIELAARKNKVYKNSKLKQTTVSAYLVDFINYVASSVGMDYGMYTSDF